MENTKPGNEQPQKLFVNLDDVSVPMFENKFLDVFSRVHWTAPVILYVPVIGYFLYETFATEWTSVLNKILVFLFGILLWTFTEYTLHRFVFHYHPTSAWGKRLHFMMHGVHHDYPQDSMRLVLPPAMSLPLAVLFYYLFLYMAGPYWMLPLYAGFVLGYLCYDTFHYATHHANFKFAWFRALKKHHMDHHYRSPDEGFGVSSTLWDIIFRSGFKNK